MTEQPIEYYINLIESHGLTVNCFGGNCPVQCHAYWTNGNHLYFRARGQAWDITIATNEDDAISGDPTRESILYYRGKSYGRHTEYDAGYMPLYEVCNIVLEAIKAVKNV